MTTDLLDQYVMGCYDKPMHYMLHLQTLQFNNTAINKSPQCSIHNINKCPTLHPLHLDLKILILHKFSVYYNYAIASINPTAATKCRALQFLACTLQLHSCNILKNCVR